MEVKEPKALFNVLGSFFILPRQNPAKKSGSTRSEFCEILSLKPLSFRKILLAFRICISAYRKCSGGGGSVRKCKYGLGFANPFPKNQGKDSGTPEGRPTFWLVQSLFVLLWCPEWGSNPHGYEATKF